MATLTNTTDHTIVFRDDAGKHFVESGEEFTVVGDQHLPHVRSLLEAEPMGTLEDLAAFALELPGATAQGAPEGGSASAADDPDATSSGEAATPPVASIPVARSLTPEAAADAVIVGDEVVPPERRRR